MDGIAALPDRIAKKIQVAESGCWMWIGGLGSNGYGQSWLERPQRAHRVVYQLLKGPIADGLQLDHLCRVKLCVNPAHLEPVTLRENLRRQHCWHDHDALATGKPTCPECEAKLARFRAFQLSARAGLYG